MTNPESYKNINMDPNPSSKSHHDNLKRLAPLFITILILIVIILGYWGYRINEVRRSTDPLSILYDTILMFKMESYESGVYNWQLVVARYLATLIVGYGVYVLVISHFRRWWSRLKVLLAYRDHTIIAGLGLKGYILATDLHKVKQKVVVIEHDPESIYLDRIRKEGIIVFISDGLEKRCWINAGLLRARQFILVMGSDDKNIEAARFISDICSRRKENFHVSGLVHMENLHNFNLLKDYLDIEYGTSKLDLNVFNASQLAAQRIWDLYPPHDPGRENPSGDGIVILVSGYTETAEAFLVENMILSRYRDLVNIRVLIVVPDTERVERELKQSYPYMADYLYYQVIAQTDEVFCTEHFIAEEDYKKLRRVYVFGEEDAEVVLRAKKLKQFLYNRNVEFVKKEAATTEDAGLFQKLLEAPQVIVCLPEKTGIVELLNYRPSSLAHPTEIQKSKPDQSKFEEKLAEEFRIIFFRQFTDSFNKSSLVDQNERITVMAKVINYLYAIKYDFRELLAMLFDQAAISYNPESLDGAVRDLEKTLLTIRLTTQVPVREIDEAIFQKIRTIFQLPREFSLETLKINHRWQLLSDRLEDSNIYSARHATIKLLYPHETEADFAALAPMEHVRWMAEKLAFQFRPGFVPKQKPLRGMARIIKNDLKINQLIVPFNEIPESEIDKDYDPYRLLKVIQQIMTRDGTLP